MVLGGWFQLVSGGFGWFRVVCCFSSYAMNEQNAQAQKKIHNKIRSMPSKSSAAT